MPADAIPTPLAHIGEPFPFVGLDALSPEMDIDAVLGLVDDLLDELTNAPAVLAALRDKKLRRDYDKFSMALLPLLELLPPGTRDKPAITALAIAQRIAFSSRVHGYRDAVPTPVLAAAYARCLHELRPTHVHDGTRQAERDSAARFFIYAVISMTVHFTIPTWVSDLTH